MVSTRPRVLAILLVLLLAPALTWSVCGACGREPGCAISGAESEGPLPAPAGLECACCSGLEPHTARAMVETSRATLPALQAALPLAPATSPVTALVAAWHGRAARRHASPPTPSPYLLHGALLI